MVSTFNTSRPASLDFRLFSYWVGLPPGRGVTMDEMMDAVDAGDSQTIRSSLTRLRKGQVSDPSQAGYQLRPLPIRWNAQDRRYYDMSNVSREAVAAMIPSQVFTGAFEELMSRVETLDSSMGQDGLVRSAQHLLDDAHTRELIRQLPLPSIWQVHNTVLRIAQARQLLELRSARSREALPAPAADET